MDSKQLEELLQKYWDCETSLEEEQQLHSYFSSGNVPEQLKETASLFKYFDLQKKKSVNDQFGSMVLEKIKPKGRVTNLWQIGLRIAAGVAVLAAAIFFVREEIRKDDALAVEDTFDDPQKALEETKKAFLIISKGFGKAEHEAKKINMLNEAKDKIQTKENSKTEL
ncbi:MAG: hypothetical protein WAZ98_11545 [Cyclobacteriaceae bacterium]